MWVQWRLCYFNDVWCTNVVSFLWQCNKWIQINIFIYFFKVDVSAALQRCVGESFQILVDVEKVKPIWKDTHFTIKYRSDALFDFPYWFGCSKRQFKVCFNKKSRPLWRFLVLRLTGNLILQVSYHGWWDQHPKCCMKRQISTEDRLQSVEIEALHIWGDH